MGGAVAYWMSTSLSGGNRIGNHYGVDIRKGIAMSETPSHKRAKASAVGRSGKTEVPISRGRRLHAATSKRATEVERGGSRAGLEKAARRLEASGKPQKVLQVPQKDMSDAAAAMRRVGSKGTVKNMSGTRRRSV